MAVPNPHWWKAWSQRATIRLPFWCCRNSHQKPEEESRNSLEKKESIVFFHCQLNSCSKKPGFRTKARVWLHRISVGGVGHVQAAGKRTQKQEFQGHYFANQGLGISRTRTYLEDVTGYHSYRRDLDHFKDILNAFCGYDMSPRASCLLASTAFWCSLLKRGPSFPYHLGPGSGVVSPGGSVPYCFLKQQGFPFYPKYPIRVGGVVIWHNLYGFKQQKSFLTRQKSGISV